MSQPQTRAATGVSRDEVGRTKTAAAPSRFSGRMRPSGFAGSTIEDSTRSRGIHWSPARSLLAPSPALLPVNGELPPLLNLRILSRSLDGKPEVLAAAGNNLFALRDRIEKR